MSTSRKDFQAIAGELARVRPLDGNDISMNQWLAGCAAVAAALATTNLHFDHERFLDACHRAASPRQQ